MLLSPQRLTTSSLRRCSHIATQFRGLRRLLKNAWYDHGVHSNATNELGMGATTAAGTSTESRALT
jgi:hypothetical protein